MGALKNCFVTLRMPSKDILLDMTPHLGNYDIFPNFLCFSVCHIDDFSAVGSNSYQQCDGSGCNWYLETDHADCDVRERVACPFW